MTKQVLEPRFVCDRCGAEIILGARPAHHIKIGVVGVEPDTLADAVTRNDFDLCPACSTTYTALFANFLQDPRKIAEFVQDQGKRGRAE